MFFWQEKGCSIKRKTMLPPTFPSVNYTLIWCFYLMKTIIDEKEVEKLV